jgi:hypothetical protein
MIERERIAVLKALAADPEQSDRSVAGQVGVSHRSVGRVRREAERTGQLRSVAARRTSDGRSRAVAATEVEKIWQPGGLAHTVARLARGEEL